MPERKITMTYNNRAFLCIPAYLRDKFGLQKGSIVDVTDREGQIVITPIKGAMTQK